MEHGFDPYARNYQSLSVADLLEARESYHIHLLHLDNVFATAIGRFRIRVGDDDYKHYDPKAHKERGKIAKPRTLLNTVVEPWSWPCVLVFVKEWIKPDELQHYRDQIVPPFLYLPDGRTIPTCTVQEDLYHGEVEPLLTLQAKAPVLASGQPIFTEVQGEEHVGTVTGIVSDGVKYYALTNQHVAGEKGTIVYAAVDGELVRIGVSAGLEQKRRNFEEIYPGLPGKFTMSNLDFGLIELDSIAHWTSNMNNSEADKKKSTTMLGKMVEFRTDTANLDWIGCKVVGYGAASGPMHGEIKALFYRYRSVGGIDYVSDFLIGDPDTPTEKHVKKADEVTLGTRPGDSGALWCVDPSQLTDAHPLPRPFAVQWGGQKLTSGGGTSFTRFALGSSLAVACRELDVDIVTDWNTEHTEYWGTVGHYKIAEMAIGLLKGDLQNFMSRHLKLITYDNILAEPSAKDPVKDFIPLADVPDLVWKKPKLSDSSAGEEEDTTSNGRTVKRYKFGRRGPENPNHYADIDLQDKDKHKELADCGTDAAAWEAFYKSAPVPENGLKEAEAAAKKKHQPAPPSVGIEFQHQGLLPFRVWQIFEEMQTYAKQGDAAEFLCAAGILAHYVGDACQPLHGSRHSDGLEGATTGVHSSYEEIMVDFAAQKIADKLSQFNFAKLLDVTSGKDAAAKTLQTMKAAAVKLPPEDICKVFDQFKKEKGLHGTSPLKSSGPVLAQHFVDKTVACMALGISLLASLWTAAFKAANSANFQATIKDSDLMDIYKRQDFLPSYYLDGWIKNVPEGESSSAAAD